MKLKGYGKELYFEKIGYLKDLLESRYKKAEFEIEEENRVTFRIFITEKYYAETEEIDLISIIDTEELDDIFAQIQKSIALMRSETFSKITWGEIRIKEFVRENKIHNKIGVKFNKVFREDLITDLEINLDNYEVGYVKSSDHIHLTRKENEKEQIAIKNNGEIVFL